MPKYINTKTKVVIETDGIISGGDWLPLKAPEKEKEQKKKAKKKGSDD